MCSPAQSQTMWCPADLNQDHEVGAPDVSLLLLGWGSTLPLDPADINRDGEVDGQDLGCMLLEEGPCPPTLESLLVNLRESQGAPWGITVPGLAAAVVTGVADHLEVVEAVSGSSNPPANTPLELGDRFHVGSVTKTFIAALIMQLVQEGKLSLSDPISRWITFPDGDTITVSMLMGHTSGIRSSDELPGFTRLLSPEQCIALAAAVPLVFAPGSSWAYSNTNYAILGVIAEKTSGSTWENALRERFFIPLGLHDTYVWSGHAEGSTVDGSRLNCGASGESPCVPGPGFTLVAEDDGFAWTVAGAAGALVSTPADIARWMNALVGGNVVDKQHLDLMITPTPQSVEVLALLPKFGSMRWTGVGLGLFCFEIDGVGTGYGHSGLINGFTANVAHVPAIGVTVGFTSNFQQINSIEALGDLIIHVAASMPASNSGCETDAPNGSE